MEADILHFLNKQECPDCRSTKMRPGLRLDVAELLTCQHCNARFYIAPRAPNANVFIRQ